MRRMKNVYIMVALEAGVVILLNLLAKDFHFRLDVTEGKQYTLSPSTGDILRQLDEPVTIKAYFSKNLPPNIEKARNDFRDLLIEYASRSRGKVQYQFVNPSQDEASTKEAEQSGIRPVMIDVREKDQMQQQKAYLGAVVSLGDKQETIPLIQPGAAMEYALSSAIKKLSVVHKPVIGFLQGHGEAAIGELSQLNQQLQVLYESKPVALTDSTVLPPNIGVLAMIRPTDSFSEGGFRQLDSFLTRGGKLLIAMNRVQADLRTVQPHLINNTLTAWLAKKGLDMGNNAVIDAQCGAIPMQQKSGFFTVQTRVRLPYLPMVSNFARHPITAGLDDVVMEFPSAIRCHVQGNWQYTPLAFTSALSDTQSVPLYLDVNKKWTRGDFHNRSLILAAALEGDFGRKGKPGKLVLIADGDFAVNGPPRQPRQLTTDNINFISNSIDWRSDNTGLIGLRTKAVTSRPIREMEESSKTTLKYLNFLLPILLAIGYGLFRARRNRLIRQLRMTDNYETV